MSKTICFAFALIVLPSTVIGKEKTALERAYPGIQTTVHSGHPKQKGYGHQGITKGAGRWFLFGTQHIYRYETTDFTVDQAKLKVKNEQPFAHADFKGTGIEHMGAPNYHDGKVYSFGKSSNATPFAKATMRLIWYSAADLSYSKGSYLDLKVPADKDGNPRVVAGGPYIVGDCFYAVLVKQTPNGRLLPSNHIGKFALATGKFLKAIRVSHSYFQPQAIVIDKAGNFYALETKGHLKKYSPTGKYLGTVFKATVPAVYEGFHLDEKTGTMTISITKRGIHIARIRLDRGNRE